MAKVRQDAWSHEDDLLLAETVLRHIREGSTQLNAFDEVGDHLNRTSAACGFRWNAEIRKKYIDAIELAKKQRKERKRAVQRGTVYARKTLYEYPEKLETPSMMHMENNKETDPPVSFDTIISHLKHLKQQYTLSNQEKFKAKTLKKENERLKTEVNELHKQLNAKEKQLTAMKEDYQTFIQIMDRARKMTVFNEEDMMNPPSFRMDKNGNLEQLSSGN